jgi:hypothetical protein
LSLQRHGPTNQARRLRLPSGNWMAKLAAMVKAASSGEFAA